VACPHKAARSTSSSARHSCDRDKPSAELTKIVDSLREAGYEIDGHDDFLTHGKA
jgi:hypothetical protein